MTSLRTGNGSIYKHPFSGYDANNEWIGFGRKKPKKRGQNRKKGSKASRQREAIEKAQAEMNKAHGEMLERRKGNKAI